MPPESPTRKYKPDSKTAPASTCLRRRRKSRRAGGLAIVDVPPAYRIHSFCTTLPPPPAIVHPWPRQRRQCGIPAVIRFDVVIVVVVVVALTYYVVVIATCLDAPSPLSLRRRLSLSMPRRLSRASIATPTPVSLHHSRASGWLLHRHLSCRAVASLVAPPPLSLDAMSPLSLRRRLYRHANACLITPLSRQRLVVESSPLSRRQCLSCRALSSLPFSLRRRLFGS